MTFWAFIIVIVYSYGRVAHQKGEAAEYGKHGLGFALSLFSGFVLEGLCWGRRLNSCLKCGERVESRLRASWEQIERAAAAAWLRRDVRACSFSAACWFIVAVVCPIKISIIRVSLSINCAALMAPPMTCMVSLRPDRGRRTL